MRSSLYNDKNLLSCEGSIKYRRVCANGKAGWEMTLGTSQKWNVFLKKQYDSINPHDFGVSSHHLKSYD